MHYNWPLLNAQLMVNESWLFIFTARYGSCGRYCFQTHLSAILSKGGISDPMSFLGVDISGTRSLLERGGCSGSKYSRGEYPGLSTQRVSTQVVNTQGLSTQGWVLKRWIPRGGVLGNLVPGRNTQGSVLRRWVPRRVSTQGVGTWGEYLGPQTWDFNRTSGAVGSHHHPRHGILQCYQCHTIKTLLTSIHSRPVCP